MAVNSDKPHLWKEDVSKSVDFYNSWFINFAPKTYRETREKTIVQVSEALEKTERLMNLGASTIKNFPQVLGVLRMITAPPIARDRLIGLSGVSSSLVQSIEKGRIPSKLDEAGLEAALNSIAEVILKLLDKDIFPWIEEKRKPKDEEFLRASSIVADRLCGAMSDPIIRNAQEVRQLNEIRAWLEARGYQYTNAIDIDLHKMKPGCFGFRYNVPIKLGKSSKTVNIPVDAIIKPKSATLTDFPILIEAKSAGDFTNTNKRRKEEAVKASQLKSTYGSKAKLVLFLCGYFDSGYLGYEAAEGIDWIWEHRIKDLEKLGLK